jgi:raffinose/stachyose/melibiose transport system permease protein
VRQRYGKSQLVLELVMILAAIIYFIPVYMLLQLSFRPGHEMAQSPLGLPNFSYVGNYIQAWAAANMGQAMLNSAIITISSLVILVAFGSMAAYALARRKQQLAYWVYILFLAGIILPFQLGLLPLYRLMSELQLLGTHASLIIYNVGHFLPLAIFLYTGFLRAIPREYEEAALVDGASHLQVFTKVVFPLLRPITGTVLIVAGVFIWNDFLTPLLYLGGTSSATIPVVIFQFVGQYEARWELVFAGLIMGSLPILALYFVLQRHVIRGFASGLKG